jgi:hypothetical protein
MHVCMDMYVHFRVHARIHAFYMCMHVYVCVNAGVFMDRCILVCCLQLLSLMCTVPGVAIARQLACALAQSPR